MKTAIAILCAFLFLSESRAASYYISNSGSDANSGTSPETPWRTVLKVNATAFSPGDAILFNGGDRFEGPFILGRSGTLANPITITSYGTGSGSIYGDHSNAVWSAEAGFPGIYSTTLSPVNSVEYVADFDGTNYANNKKGTQALTNWLASFVATNWGFFSPKVYVKTWDGNPPPQMHLFEFDCVQLNRNYITITNMDIGASHHGLLAQGAIGFRAAWNTIHDTENIGIYLGNWCIGPDIGSNTVTRTGEDGIYLSFIGNAWIHDNSVSFVTNNVMGIPLKNTHAERCGIAMQQGTNNIVERNTLFGLWGAFFDYYYENSSTVRYNYGFHANGAAFPNGSGLKLHNNTFDLDNAGPGINAAHTYSAAFSSSQDAGPNLTYSNTILNFKTYGLFSGPGGDTNSPYAHNTLLANGTNVTMAQFNTGANSDSNTWFCTGTINGWFWNGVKYSTFAAFQAASGLESNGQYADPRTNQPPPAPVRPAPPTNLRVIQSSSSGVSLQWDYDFAANPGVDTFLTAWGLGALTSFNVGDASTFSTVTGLARGKTYTFAVEAMAGGIESDLSNEVTATIPKNGGAHLR